MTNADLIETLVNYFAGGNQERFARLIGINKQTVTNWKRRKPDLQLIYDKLPEVSGDWLLSRGEADFLRNVEVNESHHNATAAGRDSFAAVIRNVQLGDSQHMAERIALLEQLLEEKERTIQLLLNKQPERSEE